MLTALSFGLGVGLSKKSSTITSNSNFAFTFLSYTKQIKTFLFQIVKLNRGLSYLAIS